MGFSQIRDQDDHYAKVVIAMFIEHIAVEENIGLVKLMLIVIDVDG